MPEKDGAMPVYGPMFPTRFQIRGIRFLEGEDGAATGGGEDEEHTESDVDGSDENDGSDDKSDDKSDDSAKLLEALRKERLARKTAEKERDTAKQALSDKDKPAADAALEQARREAEQAANEKANERIVRAELKAAAAKRVSNLTALTRLVDLTTIEVADDGTPSEDDIEAAIEQFLTDFPEFAADKSKFSGSADQGSKGKQSTPAQLTREQLKSMTPEQIEKAEKDGRLKNLLAGKA